MRRIERLFSFRSISIMPIQFLVDVFGLSREEAHNKYIEAGGLAKATKKIYLELVERERAMAMLECGYSRPTKRSNLRIGRGRTVTPRGTMTHMTDDDLEMFSKTVDALPFPRTISNSLKSPRDSEMFSKTSETLPFPRKISNALEFPRDSIAKEELEETNRDLAQTLANLASRDTLTISSDSRLGINISPKRSVLNADGPPTPVKGKMRPPRRGYSLPPGSTLSQHIQAKKSINRAPTAPVLPSSDTKPSLRPTKLRGSKIKQAVSAPNLDFGGFSLSPMTPHDSPGTTHLAQKKGKIRPSRYSFGGAATPVRSPDISVRKEFVKFNRVSRQKHLAQKHLALERTVSDSAPARPIIQRPPSNSSLAHSVMKRMPSNSSPAHSVIKRMPSNSSPAHPVMKRMPSNSSPSHPVIKRMPSNSSPVHQTLQRSNSSGNSDGHKIRKMLSTARPHAKRPTRNVHGTIRRRQRERIIPVHRIAIS